MQLKNKYWYYKNVFPKHLCNNIISYALNKNVADGLIVGTKNNKGLDDNVRKSNVVWLDEKWLYIKLLNIVKHANTQADWNFEISTAETVQFTIYKQGMHYDWHEDAFEEPYPQTVDNESLRGKTRKISLSLLLNDDEDYRGGEFEVDFGHRNRPTKTCYEIGNAGDCIVFPSDLLHKVRPVTRGIRYSLVMWTVGNPFK